MVKKYTYCTRKYQKGDKDTVTIAEALCTARDYAMLNGEKVPTE